MGSDRLTRKEREKGVASVPPMMRGSGRERKAGWGRTVGQVSLRGARGRAEVVRVREKKRRRRWKGGGCIVGPRWRAAFVGEG